MKILGQPLLLDLETALEQFQQAAGIMPEDLLDIHIHGLAVADDHDPAGHLRFALREGIERTHGPGGILVFLELDLDLHGFRRVVVDAPQLHLALPCRLLDGGDQGIGGGAEGHPADHQSPPLAGLDAGTDPDIPPPLLISTDIHLPTLREIREHLEGAFLQDRHLRLQQLVEVVGQDARGESDRNAIRAEQKQEGDPGREGHRLLLASIVGRHGIGQVGIENLIAGQRSQPAFDITGGGGGITRQHIAEVPLPLDEILLVGERHQGVFNRGIAMGMELHGIADDIGHLRELPVIIFIQGMEDAALDRLEPVVHIRDGAVADDIGGVLEEVVVHEVLERPLGYGGNVTDDGSPLGLPGFARSGWGEQLIAAEEFRLLAHNSHPQPPQPSFPGGRAPGLQGASPSSVATPLCRRVFPRLTSPPPPRDYP